MQFSSEKNKSYSMARKNQNKTGQSNGTALRDLFILKLKALCDVEEEIARVLPRMIDKATDPELRGAFEKHLEQTEGQQDRLTRIFEMLEINQEKLESDAIRGLVRDTEWVIRNIQGGAARDAALIASARYVEHYEMAGYDAAIGWARLLDRDDIVDLLLETLEEERDMEEELRELASLKIDKEVVGEREAKV
jgi:ferritin-like metal-binding protein YciE